MSERTKEARRQQVNRRIIFRVAEELSLSYRKAYRCIRATLLSVQEATQRHGQVDLRDFGLEGLTACAGPVSEGSGGEDDGSHSADRP